MRDVLSRGGVACTGDVVGRVPWEGLGMWEGGSGVGVEGEAEAIRKGRREVLKRGDAACFWMKNS